MKKALLFLLIICNSCQFFDAKKPDQEALLKKELDKINWDMVDQYPLPSDCNELLSVQEQKQCLLNYLYTSLRTKMQNDSLSVWPAEVDTLSFLVTIDTNAVVGFKANFLPAINDSVLQLSNAVLKYKLEGFPTIQPAIKQGIKVKTVLKKPIFISINKHK